MSDEDDNYLRDLEIMNMKLHCNCIFNGFLHSRLLLLSLQCPM